MFFDPAIVATLQLKNKRSEENEPIPSKGIHLRTLPDKAIKELNSSKARAERGIKHGVRTL